MATPLRVLLVEDNSNDAALLLRRLRQEGFEPDCRHVDNEVDYLRYLGPGFDVILSDFQLPQFSGLRALELLNQRGLDVPFILVSGTIGEEIAVMAMKQGAADYLLKDRLARLGLAVRQAIEQGMMRRERRSTEKALRLFRALVDQSGDTFEVIDPASGRFVDVSAKGCAECGYTREEYLGLRVADLDTALTEAGWLQWIERLREDGAFRCESVYRRKDGSLFPVELRATWVRLDRYYIVATVRDITARREAERSVRESEERFRQLAENVAEVFWMIDPATRQFLYVSPAYDAIWGRAGADLYAAPQSWWDAIHPEDRERAAGAAASARQVAGGYREIYRILRPDGTVRWISDRAFPVRDQNGAVYRVVGTAEDITERRLLEEQLRQSQKMEAVGTLAGGIAHDFNNILTAIVGFTEMARSKLGSPAKARGYLDGALEGAGRATALVRQILAFSRRQEQSRKPMDLCLVVGESLRLLRASLPASIVFDVAVADGLPPVLGDSTQIHQVMMNLCTNAWHAMRNRPGRLGVRLTNFAVEEDVVPPHPDLRVGPYVRLTISDTGHGMDRATQERIFEPFFTTKAPGEGSGLGLSAVLGIMHGHGGAVTVQSEPGHGTTFQLYFPVCEEVVDDPKSALGAPSPLSTLDRGSGQRVLLVDDEESLVSLGEILLRQLGYVPEGHGKVLEALERVRADPMRFDLVITDLTMPEMSGVEFAQALLKLRPDLPIILTTGHSDSFTATKVRELGIRELMPKPPTIQSLAETVRRALGRNYRRPEAPPKT